MAINQGMVFTPDDLKINDPEVKEVIVGFIEGHVSAGGVEGVVLAMSGGVDSSLAAALCTEAIGGKNVTGITFRDPVLPKADLLDAKSFAQSLSINFVTCDITKPLDTTLGEIPVYDPDDLLSSGNLKVRLRTVILYYFANRLDLLVVGTSNKSELLTGYFTKYGDGAADLIPLGDLFKTQVIQLAEYVDIPERILGKPPSAGLWPGQLDEDELGLPYDLLDLILYGYERDLRPDLIAEGTGVDRLLVDKVLERCRKNEHKRQLPPIPKIEV